MPIGVQCAALTSGSTIGADAYPDSDGDGVTDRYDCAPTNAGDAGICDADGYDPGTAESACSAYPGASYDPSVHPGASEVCDGKDDNCDNQFLVGGETDNDRDGFFTASQVCGQASPSLLDCDDAHAWVYPGAVEYCDGLWDNCLDPNWKPVVTPDDIPPNEHDDDGDGYHNTCGPYQDCNDANRQVHPFAAETCNGIDDNCDGAIDEGTITCGVGACFRSAPACVNGAPGTCTPGTPAPEDLAHLSSCTNQIDDDCDGVTDLDCAVPVTTQLPASGEGQVVGGAVGDLGPLPDGDHYETLRETRANSNKPYKLSAGFVFDVPSSLANVVLDLRVEGLQDNTSGDQYVLHYAKKAAGQSCPNLTGTNGWTAAAGLTISGTTEPAPLLSANIGSSSTTRWCVRVQDTLRTTDTTANDVRLDRIFVIPH